MLLKYVSILIWILITSATAFLVLVLSHFLGRKRASSEKLSPYECGITPVGDARKPVPVRFYLIAVVFLIFDIEAAFLYPWAVVYRRMRFAGLAEMGLFILVLFVGYLYLWKRGVFDWEE